MGNFIKIRPLGADLFHAERETDGRTDMRKLIVTFRSFTNATKNQSVIVEYKSSRCLF